jgi:hypothetical protein
MKPSVINTENTVKVGDLTHESKSHHKHKRNHNAPISLTTTKIDSARLSKQNPNELAEITFADRPPKPEKRSPSPY